LFACAGNTAAPNNAPAIKSEDVLSFKGISSW
jgi:hypothetical protein